MKLLVTGAAGHIGQCLTQFLKKSGHQVIGVDVKEHPDCLLVDLTDKVKLVRLIESFHPEIILHLAAITDIRFCETHMDEVKQINYGITEFVIEACSKRNIRMMYFSTDYVFGKFDRLWKEDDPTCPVTIYGQHKAECEALIQRKLTKYSIIRTAQLYGYEGDFIHLIRNSIEQLKGFKAIENLVNCPTWIVDLFKMLQVIIDQGHSGIFHCIGPEPVSRFEFALAISKAFKIDAAFIQAVKIDFSVDVRPSVVRLDGTRTYRKLNYFPKSLNQNLLVCASSELLNAL